MHCTRLATNWLLSVFILVSPVPLFAADFASDNPATLVGQSMTGDGPFVNLQPHGDSSSLEIAPQPSASPPLANPVLDREARTYEQSDQVAALKDNLIPSGPVDGRRPYLGVELEYTSFCFLGAEVNGFEVVAMAPDGPAALAGLQARKPGTALGDLETLGSVVVFPLALFTVPRLRRSGALGMPGDLIVAVDDHRVRTERELMRTLDPLRAGDVAYVTVIRPLTGGGHTTMRIALHIERTIGPPAISERP